jgi:hypothetical protein
MLFPGPEPSPNMPAAQKTHTALLRQLRGSARPAPAIKRAEAGPSDQVPFEQALSQLGSTFIRDKAPKLLPFELGFQLMEKNPEGNRAVGVFGFKVGSHYLYAPIFFLNGEIKGHELLYLKNQDLFVPMKENWIAYLLGRKPLELGSGVDRNLSHLGVTAPTMYQLVRSPYKYASDWRGDALANLAYFATTRPDQAYGGKTPLSLPEFLKAAGAPALRCCLEMCRARPEIYHAIERFHGKGILEEVSAYIHGQRKQASREVQSPYHRSSIPVEPINEGGADAWNRVSQKYVRGANRQNRVQGGLLNLMGRGKTTMQKQAASPRKPVHTRLLDAPGGPDVRNLTGKQREYLLRERYLVFDDRKPEQLARAMDVQAPMAMVNPDATNLYSVLVKPDKFRTCLVVMHPWSHTGRHDFCTVIDIESKKWVNTHPNRVWTHGMSTREDFNEYFDKLPSQDSLGDGLQLVLARRGQGTVPFRTRRVEGDVSRRDGSTVVEVSFEDYCTQHNSYWSASHNRRRHDDQLESDFPRWQRLRLTGKTGAKINRHPGGELWLPEDFRVLTLSTPKLKKEDEDRSLLHTEGNGPWTRIHDSEYDEPGALEPGNVEDIQAILMDHTYPLKVFSAGKDVFVNDREQDGVDYPKRAMDRAAAIVHLVSEHDLLEKTARQMVDDALTGRIVRVLIKRAAGENLIEGAPGAPNMPEPVTTFDPISGGRVPSIEHTHWDMPITDMISQTTNNRELYNPLTPPDHVALRAVTDAARTGQREIFDTAMLGSMLHTVRDDNMIDRFLGDVMKGMNALGRLLFNFYWHQDNFGDRYGKSDLPEIEDGLRNAFEGTGDILLALKAKRINPQLDEGISPDLSEVAGA